jgi:hypothetical protein
MRWCGRLASPLVIVVFVALRTATATAASVPPWTGVVSPLTPRTGGGNAHVSEKRLASGLLVSGDIGSFTEVV